MGVAYTNFAPVVTQTASVEIPLTPWQALEPVFLVNTSEARDS